MLDKLWDDVVAGPRPETGLEKLRKAATTRPIVIDKAAADADAGGSSSYKRTQSMPSTPTTPSTPTSTTPRGANVWRSVFHPGSNLATKGMGANLFDRPQPNSPTVYDWCRSDVLVSILYESRCRIFC